MQSPGENDERDARDLAAMVRLGRLAEGCITPPEAEGRGSSRVIAPRTGPGPEQAKARIHGVMAKNAILTAIGELWGPSGLAQLDSLELSEARPMRLDSLRTRVVQPG